MLTWNTVLYNGKQIEGFNVFTNYNFNKAINDLLEVPDIQFDEFNEIIDRTAQWQFWGRCEYEILVNAWPASSQDSSYKLDIYEQLKLNWDRFIDYVWNSYKEHQLNMELE